MVLELNTRSSASPRSAVVWLAFWNSDHMVLKSIIRTSASPRQQQSHWGLMMTQDAYFSFLTHAKQLLLVTFCETTAGNRKKWKCDVRTYGRTYGRTDRREVWNSYLDEKWGKIENSNKSGIYQVSITRYKNELFVDKRKGHLYMKEEWLIGLRR